jgi:hypothetical protein
VTFKGQFFGSSPPASLTITIGSQSCLSPTWISETEVSCLTPPVPTDGSPVSDLPITVIVNGQSSGSTPLGILTGTAGFRYGPVDCNAACGYNQACDDATGSCTLCVPGWTGAECDAFAVRFEPVITARPLLVAESRDLFLDENGAVSISLREPPDEGPVTFGIQASLRGEVTVDPPEVTFGASDFSTPQTVTVRAVADGVKDGNRTVSIFPAVVVGKGRYKQSTAQPVLPVSTADAFPTVSEFAPSVVPLAGQVTATITGEYWDTWVEVWFASVKVGEFRNELAPEAVTGQVNATKSRSSSGHAPNPTAAPTTTATTTTPSSRSSPHLPHSADLPPRRSLLHSQQQPNPGDGDAKQRGRVSFRVDKSHVAGAAPGYQTITVVNIRSRTRAVDPNSLYATEDCPFPGQFGRGADCADCPTGGECPGGYRVWPREGYWNPGEDSG